MNNNEVFIAVSSNSRELYKADIYRILSKPNNSIEHFRYQKKWIDTEKDEICIDHKQLKNKTALLIFKDVSSNKYIPIRSALIVDYYYDRETEVYHYYFRLGNFCDLENQDSINFLENSFFYKLSNIKSTDSSWKTKIGQIKSFFNERIFYKIDGIKDDNGKLISLHYDDINNSYFYKFTQGSSYSLILSIANPNDSKDTLSIVSSSDDINIVVAEKYHITIPYDNIKIPISTKTLDAFREKSFISFYLNSESEQIGEYENHLHISKTINIIRPIVFGLLSTIIIACTWLIKDKTMQIENIFCWSCPFDLAAAIYVILILLSTSYLLAVYNKK